MKKFTSILLAGAMALGTAMSVSAAAETVENTTIKEDTVPPTAQTTVSMTVSPTYTVTIPTAVTLTSGTAGYTGAGEISTTGAVRIAYGKKIYVTVVSTNAFNLKSAENALQPYTMQAGGNTITAQSNQVAAFEVNENAQKAELTYSAEEPAYSGTFTDLLTFTIAVR